MSDEIVGIAVLDRREPELEMLFILCRCTTGEYAGKELPTEIPVYPVGGKKVREHQWQYRIESSRLQVTPSVNWIGVFHNGASWSVEFREFDPSQWKYPGDQFRALNGR